MVRTQATEETASQAEKTTYTGGSPVPNMQYFRYSLAFLIIPTLAFALLKEHYFIIRGLINIDYMMAGVATAWFGPLLGGLAFAFALLFDLTVSFAPTFHFKPGGFMESVSELMEIDRDYVLIISAMVIIGIGIYSYLTQKIAGRSDRKIKIALLMFTLLVTAIVVDAFSTGNALKKGDTAHIQTNIATSSSFESLRTLYRWSRHVPPETVEDIQAASDPIRDLLKNNPDKLPKNIVLVVVESWGHFNEAAANELQASALNDPAVSDRYEVTTGSLPFYYSTVPGELRELCGVKMPTLDPDVERIPPAKCLPKQLAALGYKTAGMHGFARNFFNRHSWYPAIGLDEVLFARDIDRIQGGTKRCGVAFSGICDADAMDVYHQKLLQHKEDKQFLYWLTLNGHTPFPEPDDRFPKLDCSLSKASANNASVCRLMGVQNIVISAVIKAAMDPEIQDSVFILAGDHAPPFVEQHTRKLFSHETVPFAILWPKETQAATRSD